MLQPRVCFQSQKSKKFIAEILLKLALSTNQSINQSTKKFYQMFETTCILMFLCSVFPQTSIVTQHITIALWNINYSLFIYLSYYCCLRRHIKVIIDVYADILKHLLKVLFQDLSISLCTHLLLINIFTCHMHLWLKFFCLFCIHEDEYHYLVHCNQFSRRILLTTLRHIPCNMRYMTWNNETMLWNSNILPINAQSKVSKVKKLCWVIRNLIDCQSSRHYSQKTLEHEFHKNFGAWVSQKFWSMSFIKKNWNMSFIKILEHEFHTHTPRPAPGENLSVISIFCNFCMYYYIYVLL